MHGNQSKNRAVKCKNEHCTNLIRVRSSRKVTGLCWNCYIGSDHQKNVAKNNAANKNLKLRQYILTKKFNRLTPLKYLGTKSGTGYWECLCDCGNKCSVATAHLLASNVKSCGCLVKEMSKLTIQKLHDFQRSQYPSGKANQNATLRIYKKSAEKRKIPWELSEETVLKLFSQNCFYCGAPPMNCADKKNSRGAFIYNGIDRKDNNLGYTIENCVSCCGICNRAKNQMPFDAFSAWLDRIKNKNQSLLKYFVLNRKVDISGKSGTGIVAIGVILPSGKCVLEWLGSEITETIFESVEQIERIHGHGGLTAVEYVN